MISISNEPTPLRVTGNVATFREVPEIRDD